MVETVEETEREAIASIPRVRRDKGGPYLFPALDAGADSGFALRQLQHRIAALEAEKSIKYETELQVLVDQLGKELVFGQIPFTIKLMLKESMNDHFDQMVADLLEQAKRAKETKNMDLNRDLSIRAIDILLALNRVEQAAEIAEHHEIDHDIIAVWKQAGEGDDAYRDVFRWAVEAEDPIARMIALLAFAEDGDVDFLPTQIALHASFISIQDGLILATARLGWNHKLTQRLHRTWLSDLKAELPPMADIELFSCRDLNTICSQWTKAGLITKDPDLFSFFIAVYQIIAAADEKYPHPNTAEMIAFKADAWDTLFDGSMLEGNSILKAAKEAEEENDLVDGVSALACMFFKNIKKSVRSIDLETGFKRRLQLTSVVAESLTKLLLNDTEGQTVSLLPEKDDPLFLDTPKKMMDRLVGLLTKRDPFRDAQLNARYNAALEKFLPAAVTTESSPEKKYLQKDTGYKPERVGRKCYRCEQLGHLARDCVVGTMPEVRSRNASFRQAEPALEKRAEPQPALEERAGPQPALKEHAEPQPALEERAELQPRPVETETEEQEPIEETVTVAVENNSLEEVVEPLAPEPAEDLPEVDSQSTTTSAVGSTVENPIDETRPELVNLDHSLLEEMLGGSEDEMPDAKVNDPDGYFKSGEYTQRVAVSPVCELVKTEKIETGHKPGLSELITDVLEEDVSTAESASVFNEKPPTMFDATKWGVPAGTGSAFDVNFATESSGAPKTGGFDGPRTHGGDSRGRGRHPSSNNWSSTAERGYNGTNNAFGGSSYSNNFGDRHNNYQQRGNSGGRGRGGHDRVPYQGSDARRGMASGDQDDEPVAKRARMQVASPDDFDDAQKESLRRLDLVQTQLDKLSEKATTEMIEIEKKFIAEKQPHYATRNALCNDIPEFWYKAFMQHPEVSELITDEEEKALSYLTHFEVDEHSEPGDGFKLIFKFKENPYFQNDAIIKHYKTSEPHGSSSVTPIVWKGGELGKLGDDDDSGWLSFFAWMRSEQQPEIDQLAELLKDELWSHPLDYFLGSIGTDEDEIDDLVMVDSTD
ncbi:unnamed protein product, partial [Mesorhabditis spiculigera]